MIGIYLMYAAGYTLSAVVLVAGLGAVLIGYKEGDVDNFIGGIPTACLGLFFLGLLAYQQFPPIAEACK